MKIRSAVIVLGVFGLLAGSVYGSSHTLATYGKSAGTGKTGISLGETIPSKTAPTPTTPENANSSATPEASNSNPSSSTQPVSSPAPGGDYPIILEQVQNSGHFKLFSTLVAKGPSVKNPNGEHYGDSCIRCHSAVKILDDPSAKLDDFFSGGKYANQTEGISCRVCHIIDGSSYKPRTTGWESCGSCHVNSNGNPTPGNEVLHPQFQMIQGVAIGDLMPMPSYKYKYMKDTFSCTDCHVTDKNKHDFMVPGVTVTHDAEGIRRTGTTIDYQAFRAVFSQDKCAVCHPSSADMVDRVKNEQATISKKLAELKPIYEEWSNKVASMNPDDPKVLAFKNGATYYTFVEADGSKGAHNFPYAQTLLAKAEKYWQALKDQ